MSNITECAGLLDDLREQGPINEMLLLTHILRSALEDIDHERLEKILADAEAYQISIWDEQDARKEENRKARARKLAREVIATQGATFA